MPFHSGGLKKVSVIVPVYNAEEFLIDCLESILFQKYKNIEIVLVNDGSTDGSGNLCREYKNLDNRIVLVEQENQGVSVARNVGIASATGEFITFVDADDKISPDLIHNLIKSIYEEGSDIAIGRYQILDKNGAILFDPGFVDIVKCNAQEALNTLLYDSGVGDALWSKVYRKNLFIGLNFPAGRVYEDVSILYLLIHKAKSISLVQNAVYYHFENKLSITSRYQGLDYVKACSERLNFVKEFYPAILDQAKAQFFSANLTCKIQANELINSPDKDIEILNKNLKDALFFYIKSSDYSLRHKVSGLLKYYCYSLYLLARIIKYFFNKTLEHIY
jgi:glycosyltransferase involved in cell wall biosynthesis